MAPEIPDKVEDRIQQILETCPLPEHLAGPKVVHRLLSFSNPKDYAHLYSVATVEDFEAERNPIDDFNKSSHPLKAWVMENEPGEGFIIRADICGLHRDWPKPKVGDECHLILRNGPLKEQFEAVVSPNKIKLARGWSETMEFVLAVPHSQDYEDTCAYLNSRKIGTTIPNSPHEAVDKSISVRLELKLSWQTLAAELASLERLIKLSDATPSSSKDPRAKDPRAQALEYILDFKNPGHHRDLSQTFPALRSGGDVADVTVRGKLSVRINRMLKDEYTKEIFDSLKRIPAGVKVIPGCFGAGKTGLCMLLAAICQAGTRSAKVLYLVDINRPLDDVTRRMRKLYQELGMKKTALRMRHLPREMRDSEFGRPKKLTDQKVKVGSSTPDYRRDFLLNWKLSRALRQPNDLMQQPADEFQPLSLDQAAFDHYQSFPSGWDGITCALKSLDVAPKKRSRDDWDNIDNMKTHLLDLYNKVLEKADFLAMTPCAAFNYADRLFRPGGPDLVILDEAGHCRELSSLIPLACFRPAAWIFAGDYRQSQPRTNKSDLRSQLELSLLERAAALNSDLEELRTTYRPYAGLHKLPSLMFYEDSIKGGHERTAWPESVHHLLHKLNDLAYGPSLEVRLKVPRLVIDSFALTGGLEFGFNGNYDNRIHREWVMAQAVKFLNDPEFTHVNSASPGYIMIVSPYKAGFDRYNKAIQKLPGNLRSRISATTVDLSQGRSADLVFVDMVVKHSNHFNCEPKRLCTALTRARQAEIIVMSGSMISRDGTVPPGSRGIPFRPMLRDLWDFCKNEGQGAVIRM